ncbi:DNA/RNA nuclease SfsA [Ensifer soli]|uniref:DNA/RNA nuclease SfsA n=1 Tax=Ciceribacter sp. sgz301302 TaxID=3342379 RepID=UPI0035B99286
MRFAPPLVPATLVRRYKRFLFDAVTGTGAAITGFCPNTGSMRGLTEPGIRIWMSEHDSPARKYRHALEMVEIGGDFIGVNTALPNRLAEEAIVAGQVADLASYATLERERAYGAQSRIDMLLTDPAKGRCYVEVKNVHFSRSPGLAEFPDSPTQRGARHLDELSAMVAAGHRAVMVYLVQRGDCDRLAIAADFDPAYADAFRRARAAGVEAYAVACAVSPAQITPTGLIAIDEQGPAAL